MCQPVIKSDTVEVRTYITYACILACRRRYISLSLSLSLCSSLSLESTTAQTLCARELGTLTHFTNSVARCMPWRSQLRRAGCYRCVSSLTRCGTTMSATSALLGATCCYTLGCLISESRGADSHLQPCIPVYAGVLGGETHLLALECGDIHSGFFAPAPVGALWQFCQGGPAVRQVDAADFAMRQVSVAPAHCGDPQLFESLKGVCSPSMQSMVFEAHVLRICTMALSGATPEWVQCVASSLPCCRAVASQGLMMIDRFLRRGSWPGSLLTR